MSTSVIFQHESHSKLQELIMCDVFKISNSDFTFHLQDEKLGAQLNYQLGLTRNKDFHRLAMCCYVVCSTRELALQN